MTPFRAEIRGLPRGNRPAAIAALLKDVEAAAEEGDWARQRRTILFVRAIERARVLSGDAPLIPEGARFAKLVKRRVRMARKKRRGWA